MDMMQLSVAFCNLMNAPKNDTSFMDMWVSVWMGMWRLRYTQTFIIST